ncbi:MAG: homoserine dehydrogenase [Clostridia bacterium]|nr:homoserine dehydrogenase [Clostridia bacterium]
MIHVALLGFGVVGSGAAEVLTQNKAVIEKKVGSPVNIKYILDLREFPDSPFGNLIVHDFDTIVNDPEVSLIAEMMGGSHPAYDFSLRALRAGKSVVTSNKEVVANFGTELLAVAREMGVAYLFEASVGGGIPLIRPLREDLASNNITAISGILNGTTNYILTKMDTEGTAFEDALRDAQARGYAEANPAADIEGIDAARKIVILAAMAFCKRLSPADILCEGITAITAEDSELAAKLGYTIKLIGYTTEQDGRILAMVSPRLVPLSSPIAGVNGVFNGVLISADMVGEVMFYGPGAGKLPTASAVVGDMMDIMSHGATGVHIPAWEDASPADVADPDAYVCRHMIVLDATVEAIASITLAFEGCIDRFETTNGRVAFITGLLAEGRVKEMILSCGYPLISRIRVL